MGSLFYSMVPRDAGIWGRCVVGGDGVLVERGKVSKCFVVVVHRQSSLRYSRLVFHGGSGNRAYELCLRALSPGPRRPSENYWAGLGAPP